MLHLIPVFAIAFFASLNFGSLLYINSQYLSSYFPPYWVSSIFILGALLNIILFTLAPKLLESFSKKILLFSALTITLWSTLTLAFSQAKFTIVFSAIVYTGVSFMIFYFLDIFLEKESSDSSTGELRGGYLTLINTGIALGPILLTIMSPETSLRPVFLFSSFLLIPALIIAAISFKKGKALPHNKKYFLLPFSGWWHDRNIRAVTLSRFILEFFYGIMVIYTPIYLYGTLGFSWSSLGIIFAVALLPFILFELPAGFVADKYLGEKEIMSLGFFLIGITLLVMPFLGKNFWQWMAILFISRIGASLVEIMTETYFFKKISVKDSDLMGIFRLTRPMAICLAALFGAIFLNYFTINKIFFGLAVVILYGLKESLYLKDTK